MDPGWMNMPGFLRRESAIVAGLFLEFIFRTPLRRRKSPPIAEASEKERSSMTFALGQRHPRYLPASRSETSAVTRHRGGKVRTKVSGVRATRTLEIYILKSTSCQENAQRLIIPYLTYHRYVVPILLAYSWLNSTHVDYPDNTTI